MQLSMVLIPVANIAIFVFQISTMNRRTQFFSVFRKKWQILHPIFVERSFHRSFFLSIVEEIRDSKPIIINN